MLCKYFTFENQLESLIIKLEPIDPFQEVHDKVFAIKTRVSINFLFLKKVTSIAPQLSIT